MMVVEIMDSRSDVVTSPEVSVLIAQAKAAFSEKFGRAAEYCGIAPGRVNLIGEHTGKSGAYCLHYSM